MKFRLHPVLLPVFLFLIVTGNLSTYTIVLLSLLIHEAGHLIAARMTGMRVKSCTIMPYGGELIIPGRHAARRRHRVYLALGGPVATMILLIIAVIFSFPEDDLVIKIQLVLLALNLLPILPLDGGQVLTAILETKGAEYSTRAAMLVHSMVFLSAIIILFSLSLPKTMPYMILALFLLFQNVMVFRFRRYEKAFEDMKINKLTK